MERFTISLDDELAKQFDALVASKGYATRSEAVRDLIRSQIGSETLTHAEGRKAVSWCAATVSYVYNHHEQTVTSRLFDMKHAHHDMVVSSLHTHLDHDHGMETVVLRGPAAAVRACAEQLIALRGVRHGSIHLVPLVLAGHGHRHAQGAEHHTHLKPLN